MQCKGKMMNYSKNFWSEEVVIQAVKNLRHHDKTPLKVQNSSLVGGGTALMFSRLIRSMLYGIQPHDPATLAGGVLILLAVALAASWIPAQRAAGMQPMDALRHE